MTTTAERIASGDPHITLLATLPPNLQPRLCRRLHAAHRPDVLALGIALLAEAADQGFTIRFINALKARIEQESDPEQQARLRGLLAVTESNPDEVLELQAHLVSLKQIAEMYEAILQLWPNDARRSGKASGSGGPRVTRGT